jgi:hypothetical protein
MISARSARFPPGESEFASGGVWGEYKAAG